MPTKDEVIRRLALLLRYKNSFNLFPNPFPKITRIQEFLSIKNYRKQNKVDFNHLNLASNDYFVLLQQVSCFQHCLD